MGRAKQALAGGRKPIEVMPAERPEAEFRILAAMDDETAFTFVETPLNDALQVLAQTHDIPILADRRALDEIGLTRDAPVTLDLKHVTLRSALRLMLRDLDLTYMVRDEVLQITTADAAEENLILEMYVLPANLAAKSDQVIKVLTATVVPDTWESMGGVSTAMTLDHVLVLSTTSDVHAQAKLFLGKLIEKYGK